MQSNKDSFYYILPFIILILLLPFCWSTVQSSPVTVLPELAGKLVPTFNLPSLLYPGKRFTHKNLRGHMVILNIWASWCKPCEQEAEALQTAWLQYEGRGDVLFLGVDYVDTEKEALAYLDRWDISYPNGPDLGTQIYTAFRARGVPETFIINKMGEVAYVKIGPFQGIDEITSVIDRLLEP